MFSNEELLKNNRYIENLQYLNPWENISQKGCWDFIDPCDNGNLKRKKWTTNVGKGVKEGEHVAMLAS